MVQTCDFSIQASHSALPSFCITSFFASVVMRFRRLGTSASNKLTQENWYRSNLILLKITKSSYSALPCVCNREFLSSSLLYGSEALQPFFSHAKSVQSELQQVLDNRSKLDWETTDYLKYQLDVLQNRNILLLNLENENILI